MEAWVREVVLGAKAPAPAEAEKLQALTRALVEAGFASPARAAGGPGERALPEERLKELCKGCAPVSIPMNYRKKIFNALKIKRYMFLHTYINYFVFWGFMLDKNNIP